MSSTSQIVAALAQQEREMIREHTEKALDGKLTQIGQWREGANSFLSPPVSLKAGHSNRQRVIDNEHNRRATELIMTL